MLPFGNETLVEILRHKAYIFKGVANFSLNSIDCLHDVNRYSLLHIILLTATIKIQKMDLLKVRDCIDNSYTRIRSLISPPLGVGVGLGNAGEFEIGWGWVGWSWRVRDWLALAVGVANDRWERRTKPAPHLGARVGRGWS